ncbi:MAG TPA: helix-turn-helix domain-containing protein [Methylomirabilota bacterium]|jgi:excisionase family DNA binding protein|nr:helix-turn-helix domain-containing protein [Methylomirabilota bacterium]
MTALTIPQIAERLQLHVDTVYRLAKAGRLPVVKVGGSYRAHPEMIERLLRGEWQPSQARKVGRPRKPTLTLEEVQGQELHEPGATRGFPSFSSAWRPLAGATPARG